MLRKYIRAFVKIRTLLILLIILITIYFYHDKFREVSGNFIEESRKEGAFPYFEDDLNKAKRIRQMNEGRAQRVVDLAGERKLVREKNGLFELEVPENWRVSLEQGSTKYQISKISIESPTYSKFNIGDDFFCDNGAQLEVTVMRGVQQSAKDPNGSHGPRLIRKEDVTIGEEKGFYHVIRDENLKEGETADAHVIHDRNTYHFLFIYNPKIFGTGEFIFQEMLNSVRFDIK